MPILLENQASNLELSRKIKELGVIEESIFFYEWSGAKELSINGNNKPYFNIDGINAYTVAELEYILCKKGIGMPFYNRYKKEFYWRYGVDRQERMSANTGADIRAKILIYLIESKHINPKDI